MECPNSQTSCCSLGWLRYIDDEEKRMIEEKRKIC